MGRFLAIRLLQFPLILAIIYLATFMLVWVAPGDPFARTDRKFDPAAMDALRERMHAKHWYTFLGYYPTRMLVGDFGPSFSYDLQVSKLIGDALPVSASLGVFALCIAVIFGTAVGALAAVRRNGPADWLSLTVALIGISVPSFVAASLLFAMFSMRVHLFAIGRWGSLGDMVLPGVALSLLPTAYITRLTRASMIDVLGSDYIRTALAKGVSRRSVVWRHALRNAFLPVFSYLGPAAADTMTGSFVVEKVFNIPGLGTHFVNSVLNRDQTLILGIVMVYSVLLLSMNLLVDLGYAFVDPRIDVTAKSA
ncbi:MAG: binding--dependent transport system inner rane component family protein [Phycisphaerales bacterium]|nr:binding--dependent transport system inner rane component family protein [Phycisphaerales bacterium]